MAKTSSSGKVLPDIIERALKDKQVFIFGELLQIKGIETCGKHLATLKLFAHGNWTQYLQNKSSYITLTEDMQKKLKMLSLVELCTTKSLLTYEEVSKASGIPNTIDDVEALVLSCSFEQLIECRIDQRAKIIHILSISDTRDVP